MNSIVNPGRRKTPVWALAASCLMAILILFSPITALALNLQIDPSKISLPGNITQISDLTADTVKGEETVLIFTINSSTYTVNGASQAMDVGPTILEGRTLLPIRFAAEPLGAEIGWDGPTQKATVSLGATLMELRIGQSSALVNGKTVPIDADNPNVQPLIISGRTMLPLRFVTENLGCDVQWDPGTKKVTITGGDSSAGTGFMPGIGLDPGKIGIGLDPGKITLKPDLKSMDIGMIKNTWGIEKIGQPRKVAVTEADLPIVQRVGRGYNVFDKYASTDSLKNAVLDVSQLLQDQKVERIRFNKGEQSHIISESIRSYSNSRSVSLGASGSYFGFGGSVKTSFDTSRTQNTNNYFATSSWVVKKYGVYVIGGTDLKKYLTEPAREMLNDNSVKPSKIFDTFGHYVLVDTITGGRMDYNVTASSEASTSFENFKMAAKASFNAIIASASISGSYENMTNKEAFDSNKEDNLVTDGGAFALNISQLQADPYALTKWESTLEDHGTLVDFGTTTTQALVPIWTLCDDLSRAVSLKVEFNELNLAAGNKWPTEKYLTALHLTSGANRDQVLFNCPEGFVIIPNDLNELSNYKLDKQGNRTVIGKYQNYIFLAYKLDENPNNAYTDFFMEFTGSEKQNEIVKTTHNGNTAKYNRFAFDLNATMFDSVTKKQNPRHNYIYLWETKDKTLPPIKEIKVVFDEDPVKNYPGWQVVPWKNTTEPADANRQVTDSVPVYIIFRR